MHYIDITEPSLESLSRDVAHWFLEKYLPKTEIELSIIPLNLRVDEALGWTLKLDDNEFEIEIKKNLSKKEYIITLLHELVHVWQHTRQYQCEYQAYYMEGMLAEQYMKKDKLVGAQ